MSHMSTETNNEIILKEEQLEQSLDVQLETKAFTAEEEVLYQEMIKAGVLYGRKKSKTNPKMTKYIFTTRKGIEIFDLAQTVKLLDQAVEFLREKIKNTPNNSSPKVLVVGTQPAAKELVKSFSDKFGLSYVTERWLGGTLTNFKVISQRINYYLRTKADKETGRLDKYTKHERLKINELITKMAKVFVGLEKVTQVPEVVLVVDPEEHQTAIREANRLKIPVVAISSTDANPDQIQYLIPANDNARSSLVWIFGYIEKKLSEAPIISPETIVSK